MVGGTPALFEPSSQLDSSAMSETEMKIDASRASALTAQLQGVKERIAAVAKGRQVRLVAVSKLKPANDILALHESAARHLHFGENYAQELRDKAALLPKSVRWHFIGGLQSSRAICTLVFCPEWLTRATG